MAMMAPLLEARGLHRFFHDGDEEVAALRGVSLEVPAGRMVAVTGPSGSGKTTLLSCLAGLDEPDGGVVLIAGARLTRRNEALRSAIRGRHIGVLLQTGNLLDHLTLTQNVVAARRLSSAGCRDRARSEELLGRLGLERRRHAWPDALSGGELARAGLAVALANEPTVVLADEPTGELDSTNEATVLALLRECADMGAAVVVVTHSDAVAAAADEAIALVDGRRVA